MPRLAALAAAAFAAAALVSSPAGASSKPQILFECKDTDWSVRLVGSAEGKLVLVTSKLGGAPSTANVTSTWVDVREGHVTGQQGGHQSHLRLYDGYRQIILYEGLDGELTAQPGRTYAGALTSTETDRAQDFHVSCQADDINSNVVENTAIWAERTGGPFPYPEDEGGEFDAWF